MKPLLLYEAQACSCKVEGEERKCCGEDCINRMIYTECSPQQCPCAEKCSNQRIQRHEWAPGLDKFMTKDKVVELIETCTVLKVFFRIVLVFRLSSSCLKFQLTDLTMKKNYNYKIISIFKWLKLKNS